MLQLHLHSQISVCFALLKADFQTQVILRQVTLNTTMSNLPPYTHDNYLSPKFQSISL